MIETKQERRLKLRAGYQREYRKRHPQSELAHHQRWLKSFGGYYSQIYRHMRRRCQGHYKLRYLGLDCMDYLDWGRFMDATIEIRKSLFDAYVKSGRQRRLAPSIDRIDNNLGYTFSNCQWLTQSENSKKGSADRGPAEKT